jgi:hypothetical protein
MASLGCIGVNWDRPVADRADAYFINTKNGALQYKLLRRTIIAKGE